MRRVMWSEGMRGFAGTGWVLVAMLVAGGCASVPRAEILAALPNTTEEQFLTLRWALIREAGAVRAVGGAESAVLQWDATVALEGVDGRGLVLSRGVTIIRPGFGPGPTSFEAELVPKGGETEYRLHVVALHRYTRPGR
jgi:hypothetical protein